MYNIDDYKQFTLIQVIVKKNQKERKSRVDEYCAKDQAYYSGK